VEVQEAYICVLMLLLLILLLLPEFFPQLVPTCQQGMRGFRGCCAEVKELVNKAPQGCE
jgi:hypothetical protein